MKKLDISAIAIAMGLAFSAGAMAQNSKDQEKYGKDGTAVETPAKAKDNTNEAGADSRKDTQSDKTDANYDAAKEKCDALAGDAKSDCVNKAKARFGKP
jgi:hypothetical protein